MPSSQADFNLAVLNDFRSERLQQSISQNPYYFSNIPTLTVGLAAYSFIFRLFANHTQERPEGILNGDVLKSFFAISGEPGNFQYVSHDIFTRWVFSTAANCNRTKDRSGFRKTGISEPMPMARLLLHL